MTADSYTLTLDVTSPQLLVSANRRIHWAQRARTCRHWRQLTHLTARNEGLPTLDWAGVTVTVRFPDRRRRDIGNLHPYLAKPIVDGLVDACVVVDDSDDYLVGPDLRRDPDRGPLRVTVTVSELGTVLCW